MSDDSRNPFTRKIQKTVVGAKIKTFKDTHQLGQAVKNTLARKNVAGVAHGFNARRGAQKPGIFGAGLAGAQSIQAQQKKTDTGGHLQDEMTRARLGDEAADFLEKLRARREGDAKARQRVQLEHELNDVSQHWFLTGQKLTQLRADHRRNEMEEMHTKGLLRRYKTEVDQYLSQIVKEETIINQLKQQQRRNVPTRRDPRTIRLAADIVKKIRQAENNIRRIKNLSHGVEIKVKMQDESAGARTARQQGYERDIAAFSKEHDALENRKHLLEQQLRFLH